MKKLVITGMGVITPIGVGVHEYWQNLLQGKCGIGQISHFDASPFPTRIAAEILNFDPYTFLPRKLARHAARFMQFACVAALEAIEQSGLDVKENAERTGICMGTAVGGIAEIGNAEQSLQSRSTRVSPHFVPMVINNMAAANLAIFFGVLGPSVTVTTACSAGGDALMNAAFLILSDQADAVVCMGADAAICPSMVSSLSQAKALSRQNDNPQKASRPFDRDRDGFVIGEGGSAIILESEQFALKRGATILAVLSGFANTLDAYHVTAPDPHGSGAARCMRIALQKACLNPEDIGYINAHGTSTPLGDMAETIALLEVFGSDTPPVSSTKGATGHLMGAGGLSELAACIMAIQGGILPPSINLDNPDPQIKIRHVGISPLNAKIDHAMSNSLGFGGQNSSLIVSRYGSELSNAASDNP